MESRIKLVCWLVTELVLPWILFGISRIPYVRTSAPYQFLTNNSWKLRICWYWISFVFFGASIGYTLFTLMSRSFKSEKFCICSLPLEDCGSCPVLIKHGSFLYWKIIGVLIGIFVVGFVLYMEVGRGIRRSLLNQSVKRCLSLIKRSVWFMLTLTLSSIPNLFRGYVYHNYATSLLVGGWACTWTLYYQPATETGLFPTVAAASLGILGLIFDCWPDSVLDWILAVLTLVYYVGMDYYMSFLKTQSEKCDDEGVVVDIPHGGYPNNVMLQLRRVYKKAIGKTKEHSPPLLFQMEKSPVQPERNTYWRLIPYGSVEDDLRKFVLMMLKL